MRILVLVLVAALALSACTDGAPATASYALVWQSADGVQGRSGERDQSFGGHAVGEFAWTTDGRTAVGS